MDENTVKIRELLEYCQDTDPDNDIIIYINDTPIGFLPENISYDFDGSIRLHINDPLITIREK